jgi:2-iminobutanoate/2-iminopropanoate deaminase
VKKQVLKAGKALPGAPYSPCVKAGDLIFVSGQIPLDPDTGKLISGDFTAQARRCLENLKQLLEEAGSSMDAVVKTTVFLSDLNNFADFNKVYSEYFPSQPPARSAVQVARLPLDAMVEIEAVAVAGGASEEQAK